MQGSTITNAESPLAPRTITGSRGKAALCLIGSLVFVLVGAFMLQHETLASAWMWPGIVFFGVCAFVSAWLLARPQVLTLDADGFTISGGLMRSPWGTAWGDVQGFVVCKLPFGGSMIGFNFKPSAKQRSSLARFNGTFGAEGALPQGWPLSTEAMVDELNSYRMSALSQAS